MVDASALLALIFGERLAVAPDAFARGILSAVNLAEALTKMVDAGADATEAMADIEALGLDLAIVGFDRDAAMRAAALRSRTRRLGLSLGDRACLAMAQIHGVRELTADRAWSKLDGFEIVPVR
jgi:PIN domain nuclease of toxin-antitoxin system